MAVMVAMSFLSATARSKWESGADSRKADYMFMEAQKQYAIDSVDNYFLLLEQSYRLDTTNTAVGSEYGYFKFLTGEFLDNSAMMDDGLRLMRRRFETEPGDYYTSVKYADVCEQVRDRDEALRVWSTLDSLFPEKNECAIRHANILSYRGDPESAKKAYDIYTRLERSMGRSTTLTAYKVRCLLQNADTASVINEVHSLMNSSPRNVDFVVTAGDVYSYIEMPDSALYYYKLACKMDSTDGQAHYSLANYYYTVGDSVAFDREVFNAMRQGSLELDVKLSIFKNYISKLYEDTLQHPRIKELFNVLVEQNPHEAELRDLYYGYLALKEDYAGAVEQMSYSIDIDPSTPDKWRALMGLYVQMEDYNSAIKYGQEALELFPNDVRLNYLLGVCYTQVKDFENAESRYFEALSWVGDDHELCSDIMCSTGDMYALKEELDEAIEYYEMAIDENPYNMTAMNNCAYFLACAGCDLDKAEILSLETIEDDPYNATSLDTYAWVMFKKTDYARAKVYIDRALENLEEPSAEVLQHAGDIYFMTGDPDGALRFWEQALELDPDNELLQRKVTHKTYFYK